ncbi:MAG: hypothetical protein IKX54_04930 [Lachnospiraceae bacterium]|nr:hypothetical protein [Lachnospiraceae bacterium]
MRKWLIVCVVTCLLAAAGGLGVRYGLRRQATAIDVEEKTIEGSSAEAEGLVLQTVYKLGSSTWRTVAELTSQGFRTDTTFGFEKEPQYLTSHFFGIDCLHVIISIENPERIWNLYGNPGEEVLNAKDVKVPRKEISEYETFSLHGPYYDAYDAEDKICEFLRIRVLDEEIVRIRKNRVSYDLPELWYDYEWSIDSGVSGERDAFYPNTMSAYTGEKLYFALSNRSNNGKIMDFSDTPGGYGVYMLPMRKAADLKEAVSVLRGDIYKRINHDYEVGEVRTLYSVDPEMEIKGIAVSEDKTKLFVLLEDKGWYRVSVLDAESGSLLSQVDLGEFTEAEDVSFDCHAGADFGVFCLFKPDRLYIVSCENDGKWTVKSIENFVKKCGILYNGFLNSRIAFDGQRFAFMWDHNNYTYWDSTFHLAVFDGDDVVYRGDLDLSLSRANRNVNLNDTAGIELLDFRICWK